MGRARDVVEAAYRAWNARDLDTILNDYDENAEYWSTAHTAGLRGKAEIAEYCKSQLRIFQAIRFAITNVIESGDSVAVEYRLQATSGGALQPPSGTPPAAERTIELTGAEFFDLRGGKIVRERHYVDRLDLMRQLGLMPAGH